VTRPVERHDGAALAMREHESDDGNRVDCRDRVDTGHEKLLACALTVAPLVLARK
jgi:hypothetical protein